MATVESIILDALNILIIFVILLGFVGNLLTFRIYLTDSLRKHSIAIFFRAIAVIDLIMLIQAFFFFIEEKYEYYIKNIDGFLCRFKEYFFYALGATSPWLMVAISIDRLINIRFPKRFLFLYKLYFQIGVICSICTFNFVMYWPIPTYSILQEGKQSYQICLYSY